MMTAQIQTQAPPATAPAARRTRVVYLAGSGHTGSTLLALFMDSHPAIASVGEVAVKPQIRRRGGNLRQQCSCGALVRECPFWAKVFQRVRDQGIEFGPDQWTNDYRSENPLVHYLLTRNFSHAGLRAVQHWAANHLPFHRDRIRHIDRVNVAFIRAVLETKGADVFFDTTKVSMRLARLLEIPDLDVRVVTLVRDVRAYAASARRRGKSVREAAQTWRGDQEVIADMTRRLSPERRLLVRYEDLCREPADTLRRLWQFCGADSIEMPTTVLSHEHHVLGNSMRLGGAIQIRLDERWRETLGDREQAEAVGIAGHLVQQFGYQ